MTVRIDFHREFLRQAKRLRKKYHSFEKDFYIFLNEMNANPFQGSDLGNGIRKVRMSIASKDKGKSGGARVITYTVNKISDDEINITLLTIYDKADMPSVSDNFIDWLIGQIDK